VHAQVHASELGFDTYTHGTLLASLVYSIWTRTMFYYLQTHVA